MKNQPRRDHHRHDRREALSPTGSTNRELSSGNDQTLLSYATRYLPVAQTHLTMAADPLTSLGGSIPTAVPAGSGGAGASTSPVTLVAEVALGALGLALVGGALTPVGRRRQVS